MKTKQTKSWYTIIMPDGTQQKVYSSSKEKANELALRRLRAQDPKAYNQLLNKDK